jgi:hypothetical protein
MGKESPYCAPLPTRDEFMALLWERIRDESMSHHSSTLRYMEMFATYQGWDKPESQEIQRNIVVRIGECEECKRAGRPTSHYNERYV